MPAARRERMDFFGAFRFAVSLGEATPSSDGSYHPEIALEVAAPEDGMMAIVHVNIETCEAIIDALQSAVQQASQAPVGGIVVPGRG